MSCQLLCIRTVVTGLHEGNHNIEVAGGQVCSLGQKVCAGCVFAGGG